MTCKSCIRIQQINGTPKIYRRDSYVGYINAAGGVALCSREWQPDELRTLASAIEAWRAKEAG